MHSIGHSNHSWDKFLRLLRAHRIDAIADVRTVPTSKYSPQFNKSELESSLRASNIAYVFLGKELGGRPDSFHYFSGPRADYQKMATRPEYLEGIKRLRSGSQKYTIAMLCSEHDPLDCHRCLLVARSLQEKGVETQHILADGTTKGQTKIEAELLSLSNMTTLDMFADTAKRLSDAYRARALKVAYTSDTSSSENLP